MAEGVVFIGIGGYAASIDAATGTELWRTRLKGTDIVTLRASHDRLFAGAGGELFCLDPGTGRILWRNKLKGLGLGLVSFDDGKSVASAVRIQKRRAAAGAAMVAASS